MTRSSMAAPFFPMTRRMGSARSINTQVMASTASMTAAVISTDDVFASVGTFALPLMTRTLFVCYASRRRFADAIP